jgi:hypothetical protein
MHLTAETKDCLEFGFSPSVNKHELIPYLACAHRGKKKLMKFFPEGEKIFKGKISVSFLIRCFSL